MIADVNKYKHYLLVLGALVIANYVIVPLSEWQVELKQSLTLLEKQQGKVESLVSDKDNLQQAIANSEKQIKQLDSALFVLPSEEDFKLAVQAKIEKALTGANCTIERIGFKGSNEVTQNVARWTMEMRFKGDIGCMTGATRALETLTPYVGIVSYNINHSGLTETLTGKLNAQMQVNVWYKGVSI